MGKLKGLFGLALVAAAVYVGWLVLPHYVANYRLQDEMRGIARMATADGRSTDEEVRSKVMKKVKEFDVALKPDDINVEKVENEYAVWADYEVHIDLPYYPLDLKFHPGTTNRPEPALQ